MLEGLHPNRPTHVMRLATDEASARQATELLGEVFDPGETAVAAFEADGGAWALEAYFAQDRDISSPEVTKFVDDPDTGEVVPGLAIRPGGQLAGVSIRVSGAGKQVFAALASEGLRKLALSASPAVPTVLAELGES